MVGVRVGARNAGAYPDLTQGGVAAIAQAMAGLAGVGSGVGSGAGSGMVVARIPPQLNWSSLNQWHRRRHSLHRMMQAWLKLAQLLHMCVHF